MGILMTRDEVIDWLTHWGIHNRCPNICGWDNESILYKIMKSAIQVVDFRKPNTPKEIEGELVGENKVKVGADAKQIDLYKVQAIDKIMHTMSDIEPLCVVVASKIYVENKSQRATAAVMNLSRQNVRTLHSKLVLFIQNEMELI